MFISNKVVNTPLTTANSTSQSVETQRDYQGALVSFTDLLAQQYEGQASQPPGKDISASAKVSYQTLTDKVSREVDTRLSANEQAISYADKSIEAILNEPVEVEMNAQELRQAIIFARMGIDYEKVKELEQKVDMLALTKEDIKQSKALTNADKASLIKRIDDAKEMLEAQIAALMQGHKKQDLDSLEQVLFDQKAPADLLDELQQANSLQLKVNID